LEEIRRGWRIAYRYISLYTREREEEEAGRRCNYPAGDEVPMRRRSITEVVNGHIDFPKRSATMHA
jgi:hypothetical protein